MASIAATPVFGRVTKSDKKAEGLKEVRSTDHSTSTMLIERAAVAGDPHAETEADWYLSIGMRDWRPIRVSFHPFHPL